MLKLLELKITFNFVLKRSDAFTFIPVGENDCAFFLSDTDLNQARP